MTSNINNNQRFNSKSKIK